jgi:3-phenylpropionate/trans-cinnamate dioxygenase ferredoxin subunit
MGVQEALDTLDGKANVTNSAFQHSLNGVGWTPVTSVEELAHGRAKVVFAADEQIALFNSGGTIYAVANRCSHANGPLVEGTFVETTVTCPYHGSQFDLTTGRPLCGPASRPLARYEVRVDDGQVYLKLASEIPEQQAGSSL